MRCAASKSAEARHGDGSVCEAQNSEAADECDSEWTSESRHAGADPFGSGPPSGVPSAYEGSACYERAHQELLALPQGLIEQLGEEKMRQLAGLMHEVAEKFPDISEEVAGKE